VFSSRRASRATHETTRGATRSAGAPFSNGVSAERRPPIYPINPMIPMDPMNPIIPINPINPVATT
jgi:hypothetical protein